MKATSVFFDYSILSVSTEDNEYPSSNLKIYDSSTESYRSANTNETTIVIDLLSPIADPYISLYRTNFISFKIQGNSVNTWASPLFETANLNISEDPELSIYKILKRLSGFNYRYIRIVIFNQSTIDLKQYFNIGILAINVSVEDFEVYAGGFGMPVEVDQIHSEEIHRFQTNKKDIIPLNDTPVLEIRISGNFKNSLINRKKISDVFGNTLRNIFLIDRTNENDFQFYLAQRTGSISMSESITGNEGIRNYSVAMETIL